MPTISSWWWALPTLQFVKNPVMSDAARVNSVEAVERFAGALRAFQDESHNALLALDQQVARALAWFDHDLPHWWKQQVRRSFDEVARTRAAYETCRMRTVADHRPSCYEEKLDFEAAKRRLQFAQDQVEVVGRWAVRLHRDVDEFRAQAGRFKLVLETDLEKTVALLGRMLASLESYLGRGVSEEGSAPSQKAKQPSPED